MTCGNCPRIICTDGNAKDSIRIRKNMILNYQDQSPIPAFNDFKHELVEDIFRQAFIQEKKTKTFNMLKLPTIISPRILRKLSIQRLLKKL